MKLPDLYSIIEANSVKKQEPLDWPTRREDGRICLIKSVSEERVSESYVILPQAYRTWCNERVPGVRGLYAGVVTCLLCLTREDRWIRVFDDVGIAVGNLKAISKISFPK